MTLLLIGFSFYLPPSFKKPIALVGLLFYVCAFGLGFATGCWLLPCEIFSTSLRAKGVSLVTFVACGVSTISVSNFLTIKNAIAWPGCFFFFAASGIFTFLILYIYLPETKGKSLEEMSLYFAEVTGDYSILRAEKQRLTEASERLEEESERLVKQTEAATPDELEEQSERLSKEMQLISKESQRLAEIEERLAEREEGHKK